MNGDVEPTKIRIEPHENETTSVPTLLKSPTTQTSLAGPTQGSPNRPSATATPSLALNPDSSRSTSSSADAYTLKSPAGDLASNSSPIATSASAKNPVASLQAIKRKRLPQDKVGQLEDRIALDARDADAWLALIGEHQAKGKINDARSTYERFFKVFPDLVYLYAIASNVPGPTMEELCGYGIDGWRVPKGGRDIPKMSSCRLECRYVSILLGLYQKDEQCTYWR